MSEVKVKRRVQPEWPEAANALESNEGRCSVRFTIDEFGIPYEVQLEDCPEVFRASAESAAREWKIYPVKVDGKPVRSQFVLTIKTVRPTPHGEAGDNAVPPSGG